MPCLLVGLERLADTQVAVWLGGCLVRHLCKELANEESILRVFS